eukprot:5328052-Amphidinium_carterae.1
MDYRKLSEVVRAGLPIRVGRDEPVTSVSVLRPTLQPRAAPLEGNEVEVVRSDTQVESGEVRGHVGCILVALGWLGL